MGKERKKNNLWNIYTVLYKVPLSQMNRFISSYRQAYVNFPIQASAGPKALYPELIDLSSKSSQVSYREVT